VINLTDTIIYIVVVIPGAGVIKVVEDSQLDRVWRTLLQRSLYSQRLEIAKEFNSKNLWRKRGISIDPVKYGIGWSMCNAGVQVGHAAFSPVLMDCMK
jgi:xanthine dehydrogenase molybdopterin-binding subunit B